MKDDRLSVSLEPEYATAIGTAAYCFAICEWNVVWCCERLKPGSVNKFRRDKLTAGGIGKRFRELVRNQPSGPKRTEWMGLAEEFLELVEVRNQILHGNPCTAPGGAQRLSSHQIWGISDLSDAADLFSACGNRFHRLLYGDLKDDGQSAGS